MQFPLHIQWSNDLELCPSKSTENKMGFCHVKDDNHLHNLTNNDIGKLSNCSMCKMCGKTQAKFDGLGLENNVDKEENMHDGVFIGVITNEECQLLCQIASGCNYFLFRKVTETRQRCILKYGIGKIISNALVNGFLGSKFCPGETFFNFKSVCR